MRNKIILKAQLFLPGAVSHQFHRRQNLDDISDERFVPIKQMKQDSRDRPLFCTYFRSDDFRFCIRASNTLEDGKLNHV